MNHLKELIVVLALSGTIFALAKSTCLRFMRAEDFVRRRNVWFFLTVVAFASPSVWIYFVVAGVVLSWAAKQDAHPSSLYLFFYALIPPLSSYIPMIGVGQLFSLNQGRLLAIVVLLPALFRLSAADRDLRRWTSFDALLLTFVLLQVVLIAPYETSTNTMRRSLQLTLDLVLPGMVFSRIARRRDAVLDALASFAVVGAVLAAVGTFEWLRGWLLYAQIAPDWGLPNKFAYLLRGDALRSQASAGHSLTLGYLLCMALAASLALSSHMAPRVRFGLIAVLVVGIYSSHARGPWLTAVVVWLVYVGLAPEGASGVAKSLVAAALVCGALAATPLGARVVDLLPFIGSSEQSTIEYRQRVAEESWRLIQRNPWFGDPFVTRNMENLRQGYGIVDLMNAYAATALFYGLVGAGVLIVLFLYSASRTWRATRRLRRDQPEDARIGAGLLAACAGSLFFMATASIDWFEYSLLGLLSGYGTWTFLRRSHGASPQEAIPNRLSATRWLAPRASRT